jgi:iron complex outermembrane recepter protein
MEHSHGRRASFREVSARKNIFRFTSRSVPGTLVATAIATILGAAAQAQQVPTASADDSTPLQTVTITGSLLKRVDTETPSPVQVITSEDLQDSGYTNLSDVLRNLSANGQGTLSQSFGQAFASGGQGIALRGLTVGGTLTLIDGQRMVAYPLSDDNQRSFVDISAIPFNAIENVEVLKDSGSTEYGADAIAGVVNIKLKRTFVGAEITAEGGTSYKRDGTGYHLAGIFGTGDLVNDGYNAYIAIDFHKTDAIDANNRNGGFANLDWSNLPGGINTNPGTVGNPYAPYPGSTTGYLLNPSLADPTDTADLNKAAQTFLPGCSQAAQNANQCTFKFPGLIQPPSEQTNVLAKFTKALPNDWQLVTTGSVFVSNAEQVAPSGFLNPSPGTNYATGGQINVAFGPGVGPHLVSYPPITVPVGSPLNPYSEAAPLIYNFGEIGPQVTQVSTTTYRLVEDLRGAAFGWDIDANAGAMYASMSAKIFGAFSYGAAQEAINEGAYIPGISNDNAILAPEVEFHPSSQLDIAGITAQREVAQLWGGPLALAVGTQYYYQAQNAQSAPSLVEGIQIGDPVYTIGSESNAAVFTELDAQVLKNLEVDAAVRYDHYNTYGGTATPKFGVKYAPFEMLTLRGTWGKGFRAPSISESGNSGETFGAGGIVDPILCPGGVANVKGTYNSQCSVDLTGYQVSNSQLKAVTSNNLSFGFIFEPLKEFNVSVDYYRIRLTNDIISQFEAGGLGDYTSLVRGPAANIPVCTNTTTNGTPCATANVPTPVGLYAYATYPYVNAGITQTEGIDIDLRSHFDLGIIGKLKAEVTYTRVFEYNETVQGETFDLAGTHGPSGISGDTGNPKDRGTASVTWERSGASLTLSENYIGPFSITDPSAGYDTCEEAISGAATSAYGFRYAGGTPLPAAWNQYCTVHKFVETNLYANYSVNQHLAVHGSITNLFNANAPVDLQTYGGGGQLAYDGALEQDGAVGRYFTLGATYKF